MSGSSLAILFPLEMREQGIDFPRGSGAQTQQNVFLPFPEIPLALQVAANECRIARFYPPLSLPAKRQFFLKIATSLLSCSAGLLLIFLGLFKNFLNSVSIFNASETVLGTRDAGHSVFRRVLHRARNSSTIFAACLLHTLERMPANKLCRVC